MFTVLKVKQNQNSIKNTLHSYINWTLSNEHGQTEGVAEATGDT